MALTGLWRWISTLQFGYCAPDRLQRLQGGWLTCQNLNTKWIMAKEGESKEGFYWSRSCGDEFVTSHRQNMDFMASWATLQFESPFLREASIFLWFFELALPCCKNHCRRSSSVDSIKSSIFYGSHWSSPHSTESLILFFLVPLFFLSIPPFCSWRCSKSKK